MWMLTVFFSCKITVQLGLLFRGLKPDRETEFKLLLHDREKLYSHEMFLREVSSPQRTSCKNSHKGRASHCILQWETRYLMDESLV